jgi:hypothetical protein
MTNSDPYRLTTIPADGTHGTHGTHGTTEVALSRGDVVRTLLWSVAVISAVANMAASYGDAATWVHLVCGAVTVLSAGTLVVRNLRGRR